VAVQGPNNYYVTRCNATRTTADLPHGQRQPPSVPDQSVKVAKNTWTGSSSRPRAILVLWYDDSKVLGRAKDETLKDAGKVGLWTKADSVIEFDDLTVEGH